MCIRACVCVCVRVCPCYGRLTTSYDGGGLQKIIDGGRRTPLAGLDSTDLRTTAKVDRIGQRSERVAPARRARRPSPLAPILRPNKLAFECVLHLPSEQLEMTNVQFAINKYVLLFLIMIRLFFRIGDCRHQAARTYPIGAGTACQKARHICRPLNRSTS